MFSSPTTASIKMAIPTWLPGLPLCTDRSYSRLMAYEAARILFRLGCDVRVYDPSGLPQKDDVQHCHPKVQELRELSKWSDGHVWISPEQHGNLVRKTPSHSQIDLPAIPISDRSLCRRASLSSKSTGYLCRRERCARPRAGPLLLPKSAADRNRSTP